MSGTARTQRGPSPQREDDAGEGAIHLDRMLSDVQADVARLLRKLPGDDTVIELTPAAGSDPAGLAWMLASLPDDDELDALVVALDDPDQLKRLLASRDAAVRAIA